MSLPTFLGLFAVIFASSFGSPGALVTMITFGATTSNFQDLLPIFAVTYAAAVIGDISAYSIARIISNEFFVKIRRFSFFSNREVNARRLLSKYGAPIVFFTRFFITSLCAPVTYICGIEKMKKRKFISMVLAGEILFASVYLLIGFLIGTTLSDFINAANYFFVAIVLIAIMIYIIVKLITPMLKRRRERKYLHKI